MGASPPRIELVVSDIDGTLVNDRRELTDATRAAVCKLHQAGIRFTLTSARPAVGVKWLIEDLKIKEPVACFNGAQLVRPDLSIVSEKLMRSRDVRSVAAAVRAHELDLWIYSGNDWHVSNPLGPHVAHQEWLLKLRPIVLTHIGPLEKAVTKMVGVSDDFASVEKCEADLLANPKLKVSATRSQKYYLDITHAEANKGNVIADLSRLLKIPCEKIATIGDMPTDVFMFERSGVSIAMGNASPEVQAKATHITASNEEDGFARAMEQFILAPEQAAAEP